MMSTASKIMLTGALLAVSLTGVAKNYTLSQRISLREKSLNKYSVCDVNALAKSMVAKAKAAKTTSFDVRFVQDQTANYNYYLATAQSFNADSVRSAVCQYINKHQCYLYWGNVVNIAMFSDRPAPRFPLDASPHYMLSPMITCSKKK